MSRRTPDHGIPARLCAPNARALVVLAALAGVLAGCQQGGSTPATSAVGAATGDAPSTADDSSAAGAPAATSTAAATTSGTGCPEAVATNTYVRARSAHAERNTVVVTADPARRVCSGPNNGHYELEGVTEQLTLTSSARIVLLTTTPSGLGHETVAPSDLAQRLVADRFGGIFLVRGPASAVTSLEEQYHP